jgi:Fe-S-cluster containining protein
VACFRCGHCCTYAALEVNEDGVGWLEMHGIPVEDRGGVRKVIFDARCSHLREDMTCDIYEADRPQICRDYLCGRAKGAEVLERELLLKRKAELQQTFARLEADLNATAGAIQQLDWTLAQMGEGQPAEPVDIEAEIEAAKTKGACDEG